MDIDCPGHLRDMAAAHGSLLQGIAAVVTAFGSTEYIVNQGGFMSIRDAAVEIANNAVNISKMLLMELEPANEASQAVDNSASVTDSDDEEDDDDDDDDDEGCGYCGVLGCEGECVDEEEEEELQVDRVVLDAPNRFVRGTVWRYDPPSTIEAVEIVSVDLGANTCVLKTIDPDALQRVYCDVSLDDLDP